MDVSARALEVASERHPEQCLYGTPRRSSPGRSIRRASTLSSRSKWSSTGNGPDGSSRGPWRSGTAADSP